MDKSVNLRYFSDKYKRIYTTGETGATGTIRNDNEYI